MEMFLDRLVPGTKLRVPDKDPSEYKSAKVLFGHMTFGLHKTLSKQGKYISLLRDPVERVISSYYFMREQKKHHLHQMTLDYTLEELLDSEHPYLLDNFYNHQTRIMSGVYTEIIQDRVPMEKRPTKVIDREDLKIALENIKKHCIFSGILEYMVQDSRKLANIVGYKGKNTVYPYAGKTSKREKTTNISKRVIDKIKERNQIDIELYNTVIKDRQ